MKYQNSRHMKQFNKRVLNSKILGIYLYLVAEIVKNPPEMWRPGFDPWVRKIPWRKEQLSTPVFRPGVFHGLYSPWGSQKVGHN